MIRTNSNSDAKNFQWSKFSNQQIGLATLGLLWFYGCMYRLVALFFSIKFNSPLMCPSTSLHSSFLWWHVISQYYLKKSSPISWFSYLLPPTPVGLVFFGSYMMAQYKYPKDFVVLYCARCRNEDNCCAVHCLMFDSVTFRSPSNSFQVTAGLPFTFLISLRVHFEIVQGQLVVVPWTSHLHIIEPFVLTGSLLSMAL